MQETLAFEPIEPAPLSHRERMAGKLRVVRDGDIHRPETKPSRDIIIRAGRIQLLHQQMIENPDEWDDRLIETYHRLHDPETSATPELRQTLENQLIAYLAAKHELREQQTDNSEFTFAPCQYQALVTLVEKKHLQASTGSGKSKHYLPIAAAVLSLSYDDQVSVATVSPKLKKDLETSIPTTMMMLPEAIRPEVYFHQSTTDEAHIGDKVRQRAAFFDISRLLVNGDDQGLAAYDEQQRQQLFAIQKEVAVDTFVRSSDRSQVRKVDPNKPSIVIYNERGIVFYEDEDVTGPILFDELHGPWDRSDDYVRKIGENSFISPEDVSVFLSERIYSQIVWEIASQEMLIDENGVIADHAEERISKRLKRLVIFPNDKKNSQLLHRACQAIAPKIGVEATRLQSWYQDQMQQDLADTGPKVTKDTSFNFNRAALDLDISPSSLRDWFTRAVDTETGTVDLDIDWTTIAGYLGVSQPKLRSWVLIYNSMVVRHQTRNQLIQEYCVDLPKQHLAALASARRIIEGVHYTQSKGHTPRDYMMGIELAGHKFDVETLLALQTINGKVELVIPQPITTAHSLEGWLDQNKHRVIALSGNLLTPSLIKPDQPRSTPLSRFLTDITGRPVVVVEPRPGVEVVRYVPTIKTTQTNEQLDQAVVQEVASDQRQTIIYCYSESDTHHLQSVLGSQDRPIIIITSDMKENEVQALTNRFANTPGAIMIAAGHIHIGVDLKNKDGAFTDHKSVFFNIPFATAQVFQAEGRRRLPSADPSKDFVWLSSEEQFTSYCQQLQMTQPQIKKLAKLYRHSPLTALNKIIQRAENQRIKNAEFAVKAEVAFRQGMEYFENMMEDIAYEYIRNYLLDSGLNHDQIKLLTKFCQAVFRLDIFQYLSSFVHSPDSLYRLFYHQCSLIGVGSVDEVISRAGDVFEDGQNYQNWLDTRRPTIAYLVEKILLPTMQGITFQNRPVPEDQLLANPSVEFVTFNWNYIGITKETDDIIRPSTSVFVPSKTVYLPDPQVLTPQKTIHLPDATAPSNPIVPELERFLEHLADKTTPPGLYVFWQDNNRATIYLTSDKQYQVQDKVGSTITKTKRFFFQATYLDIPELIKPVPEEIRDYHPQAPGETRTDQQPVVWRPLELEFGERPAVVVSKLGDQDYSVWVKYRPLYDQQAVDQEPDPDQKEVIKARSRQLSHQALHNHALTEKLRRKIELLRREKERQESEG